MRTSSLTIVILSLLFGSQLTLANSAVLCAPDETSPSVMGGSPPVLPPKAWVKGAMNNKSVVVLFKLDDEGKPDSSRIVFSKTNTTDEVTESVLSAFRAYRFCLPSKQRTASDFYSMHFYYKEMHTNAITYILQLQKPNYSRMEVQDRIEGNVVVHAKFSENGEMLEAKALTSSTDPRLVAKAEKSMLGARLLWEDLSAPRQSLTLQIPFGFRIN